MRVHVPNVKAAIDVFAAAGDDRNMQNILGVRESRVGVAAVTDEDSIVRWVDVKPPTSSRSA